MSLKDKHQFYNYNFELGLVCYSCFRTDHSVFECPFIHLNIDREHLILKKNYSENQIRKNIFRKPTKSSNPLKLKKKIESDVCKLSFEKYYESRKRNRLKDALIRLETPVEEEEKENIYHFTPMETFKIHDENAQFDFQKKNDLESKRIENEMTDSKKSEKSKDEDDKDNKDEPQSNEANLNEGPSFISENSTKSYRKNSILNLEAQDVYTYMIYKEEIKIDNMKSYKYYFPYNNVENVVKLCSMPLMRMHLKHKKKAVKFLDNKSPEAKAYIARGINLKSLFSKSSSFGV